MKILFCGGGALGSHGILIGRDLQEDLSVVDFDRVETKNLVSQWFVKPMVGKNKATALKTQAHNFLGLKVKDYSVRLTEANVETILGEHDLIVDCFDNAESRGLVQDFVRANEKPCVHAGLAPDGEFGAIRWDRDFKIDAEDTPGQATCEGAGFLPLIITTTCSLITSIRAFIKDERELNWNIAGESAESFE